jgi:predicted transcriptional regulator YheO
LNYELNIGARKFKCTTIPIKRKEFGIVGAICINVDVNYLTEEVMKSQERLEAFFKNLCRTDMQLDENILSKDEYAKALKGKRHFKDDKS